MAECLTVDQDVVGSTPISHPSEIKPCTRNKLKTSPNGILVRSLVYMEEFWQKLASRDRHRFTLFEQGFYDLSGSFIFGFNGLEVGAHADLCDEREFFVFQLDGLGGEGEEALSNFCDNAFGRNVFKNQTEIVISQVSQGITLPFMLKQPVGKLF